MLQKYMMDPRAQSFENNMKLSSERVYQKLECIFSSQYQLVVVFRRS